MQLSKPKTYSPKTRLLCLLLSFICLIAMLPGLFLIRLKDVYATVIDHDVPVDVTDVQEPIRYKDSPDHSKNIDIMRAMRDDGSGEYDWVYCVKRGAKAPSTASARPDLSKSPKCCVCS